MVNNGPAAAREITMHAEAVLKAGELRTVNLVDVDDEEFPLLELPPRSVYPIRTVTADGSDGGRRFVVTLEWRDERRKRQSRRVLLRRGRSVN